MKNLKNILVTYRGGGYDGCIWETNVFHIDKKGEFFDIYSSGYSGIKSMEDIPPYLENADIYDLESEENIFAFQRDEAKSVVLLCVNYFAEKMDYNPLYLICDICGEKTQYGYAGGFQGCGGIAIRATTMVCEDCYSARYCSSCGEIYEGDEKMVEIDGEYYCPDCAEYERSKNEPKKP
jgi:hypothetical protein